MLEDLHILGTAKTPTVRLNQSGLIKIQGRSIPEDANLFFDKIMDWIERYTAIRRDRTQVDISFEYLNSGTSKFMLQILKRLKESPGTSHNLTVNWYYEEGDDDIQERGEYYATILGLAINFIEVE